MATQSSIQAWEIPWTEESGGLQSIELQRVRHSSVQSFNRVQLLVTHGLQHAGPPCPSSTPGAYWNPYPSSGWYHPTISSSVVPFSSHLQSCPASGIFPMSQFFASGGQTIGISTSASVLPMNTQDWSPLGWYIVLILLFCLWPSPACGVSGPLMFVEFS